jgi:TRAP-type uncharacterized transport system substrate-binding protein
MRTRSPFVVVPLSALVLVSVLCVTYFLVDPLPPRRFIFATGAPGSGYENFAKRYQRILARSGVDLEIRNSAGALDNLRLLRDASSGVQAALTTFSVAESDNPNIYSLGGTFDTPIFIFYRNADPLTIFAQFRGKRLIIGTPGTALRSTISEALKVTGAWDSSSALLDLNNAQAIDELISGRVDIVALPQPEIGSLERLLGAADIRLMNVVQAEAIAKAVPGLKHVILWRGLID